MDKNEAKSISIIKRYMESKGSKIKEIEELDECPVMIGTLNKREGPLKGFQIAEIGHLVFESKDRYIIYFNSDDYSKITSVAYYKETLKPFINFN